MDAPTEKLLLIEKVLILKSLSIFKETPESILAELAPLMQEVETEQSAVIFKEGDVGDCMYIIYDGTVRIHKGNNTLAILNPKEVFGELSLLDSETRSASATAHTDSFLFKIDQEPFYELLEERPEIARGFIKILCQRLRAQNEKSALFDNLGPT
jgi:CRP-like cAMP-binding protein